MRFEDSKPLDSSRMSAQAWQPGDMKATPFFSRLGVKHGIVLSILVMLAMTIIGALMMRGTLNEIELRSQDKGRAIANSLNSMVLDSLGDREKLTRYFNDIERLEDIDYIQIVNVSGKVDISSASRPGLRPPQILRPDWLDNLNSEHVLDRTAMAVPWNEQGDTLDKQGIDVFVVLLANAEKASDEEIRSARHLRIGINFDDVVNQRTPRLILQMLVVTMIVAMAMVIGLLLLLAHILRPLKELHKGLQEVARGNLDYEVPVYSHDEVGQVVRAFNAANARLRVAFERIEELATQDPLTSLPNRRVFDERLSSEAARSRRYGHPFGVIILDLDKFKTVNDRFGHPAGDEVLRCIAKTIEASVRETDLPARIGGEEFGIILPESGVEEVHGVAEKLRAAVEETSLPHRNGLPEGLRITISAGAACSAGHLVTPESMLAAADAALYRSKGEGRNRTTMAQRVANKTSIMKQVEDKDEPEFGR